MPLYDSIDENHLDRIADATLSDYGLEYLWSGDVQKTEYHKISSDYLPENIAPDLGEPRIIGWVNSPYSFAKKVPIVECNFFYSFQIDKNSSSANFGINPPDSVYSLFSNYAVDSGQGSDIYFISIPLSIIYISDYDTNLPIETGESYEMINRNTDNNMGYKITNVKSSPTGYLNGKITYLPGTVSDTKTIVAYVTMRYMSTGYMA